MSIMRNNKVVAVGGNDIPSQTGNAGKFLKTDGTNTSWENISGLPIGSIYSVACSSTYVPNGALPCDGSEYNSTQFSAFWTNYLVEGLLNTCTYEEYASDISTYGSCGRFAIDTNTLTFKVPTIKDGDYITQALSDSELGKAYKESSPNIKGTITFCDDNASSGTNTLVSDSKNVNSGKWATMTTSENRFTAAQKTIDASLSSSTYQDGAKLQGDNVRMRYFVQVASGAINQAEMDWSAWASGLALKVNKDLDNLSDTGKQVIDGQWIGTAIDLISSNKTLSAGTTYSYDLSTYLPDDGNVYEVLCTADGQTSATSGQSASIGIGSDLISSSYYRIAGNTTRTNYTVNWAGATIFPIGLGRTITITQSNSASCSCAHFRIYGYRRVGRNS